MSAVIRLPRRTEATPKYSGITIVEIGPGEFSLAGAFKTENGEQAVPVANLELGFHPTQISSSEAEKALSDIEENQPPKDPWTFAH